LEHWNALVGSLKQGDSTKERIEAIILISNLLDGKFVDSAGKTGVSAAQEPSTGTQFRKRSRKWKAKAMD
jgi:hypothetical protein